mmetsp:Transcript_30320/g.72149  ORF Transcript_30320/g.72149 Transcript_30320/m.72149 type:complete len:244 (-) Transcript_30320:177-908(-)
MSPSNEPPWTCAAPPFRTETLRPLRCSSPSPSPPPVPIPPRPPANVPPRITATVPKPLTTSASPPGPSDESPPRTADPASNSPREPVSGPLCPLLRWMPSPPRVSIRSPTSPSPSSPSAAGETKPTRLPVTVPPLPRKVDEIESLSAGQSVSGGASTYPPASSTTVVPPVTTRVSSVTDPPPPETTWTPPSLRCVMSESWSARAAVPSVPGTAPAVAHSVWVVPSLIFVPPGWGRLASCYGKW